MEKHRGDPHPVNPQLNWNRCTSLWKRQVLSAWQSVPVELVWAGARAHS